MKPLLILLFLPILLCCQPSTVPKEEEEEAKTKTENLESPSANITAIPDNATLLEAIYGAVDSSGDSYTPANYGEVYDEHREGTNPVLQINHKSIITIDGNQYIFVHCLASTFTMTEHQFGIEHFFYLQPSGDSWEVVMTQKDTDSVPIGDDSTLERCSFGAQHPGFYQLFESWGNRHYEKHVAFFELTTRGPQFIGRLGLGYSNEFGLLEENRLYNGECQIERYKAEFSLTSDSNPWHPVTWKNTSYIYDETCTLVDSVLTEKTITFDGNAYPNPME